MPRFRKDLHPINQEKHEITWSNIGQDAGTATIEIPLVDTVALADTNSATEVPRGAHVKWIYFEFHFSAAQTGNVNVIHWKIVKNPNNSQAVTGNSYNLAEKSWVMKRGMEMLPVNVTTVFKRVFVVKVPKKMQRMAVDDEINFLYQASSTQTINACGFAIYKYLY